MMRIAQDDTDGTVEPATDPRVGALFSALEPSLRQALFVYAGPTEVDDAIGDTFLYLCANAERVLAMANPRGYLYKVARDRVRGPRRKPIQLPPVPPQEQPEVEPALVEALLRLPRTQRVCVFLVTGLRWRWVEVAEFLDLSVSTVRNHHRRGMTRLRAEMGQETR